MTSIYKAYAEILGDLADLPRASAYIECTDECKAQFAEWEAARDAYAAQWPNYCRKCSGNGGHVYQDDPGDRHCSLSGGFMEFDEPCIHCLENGICPRCGKLAWPDDAFEQETLTCPHCGWNEDKAAELALPEQPECLCWEKDLP